MTLKWDNEIVANLERAQQSLKAAKELYNMGYFDFSASRAYYCAFYGATAVLLKEGLDFTKHSGVIASIHKKFVREGKLSLKQGKDLNWLFEIRNIADYGGIEHISKEHCERAIKSAENFLKAVKTLLNK